VPTNRKRIRRQSQAQPWQTEFLLYGYYTLPSGKRSIIKTLLYGEAPLPNWEDVRGELLPAWIKEHPCTRPFSWWEEEAPEARRRAGASEPEQCLYLKFGVPASSTWWAGINPDDPLAYESQAAYLQRHNLLTTAEKKWLAQHPEALEPERIEYLQIV
jgi:hypothetical protein